MLSKTISIGAGIGIGSVQLAVTEGFTDPKWRTYGNIILGGLAVAITQLTNLIKDESFKNFVMAYGFTAAFGGIIKGVFPLALNILSGGRLGVSPLTGKIAAVPLEEGGTTNGYYTETYYPGFQDSFYRRPQTRAAGFGSDVTINPMAAIPTTIPYNKIIF